MRQSLALLTGSAFNLPNDYGGQPNWAFVLPPNARRILTLRMAIPSAAITLPGNVQTLLHESSVTRWPASVSFGTYGSANGVAIWDGWISAQLAQFESGTNNVSGISLVAVLDIPVDSPAAAALVTLHVPSWIDFSGLSMNAVVEVEV